MSERTNKMSHEELHAAYHNGGLRYDEIIEKFRRDDELLAQGKDASCRICR